MRAVGRDRDPKLLDRRTRRVGANHITGPQNMLIPQESFEFGCRRHDSRRTKILKTQLELYYSREGPTGEGDTYAAGAGAAAGATETVGDGELGGGSDDDSDANLLSEADGDTVCDMDCDWETGSAVDSLNTSRRLAFRLRFFFVFLGVPLPLDLERADLDSFFFFGRRRFLPRLPLSLLFWHSRSAAGTVQLSLFVQMLVRAVSNSLKAS